MKFEFWRIWYSVASDDAGAYGHSGASGDSGKSGDFGKSDESGKSGDFGETDVSGDQNFLSVSLLYLVVAPVN